MLDKLSYRTLDWIIYLGAAASVVGFTLYALWK